MKRRKGKTRDPSSWSGAFALLLIAASFGNPQFSYSVSWTDCEHQKRIDIPFSFSHLLFCARVRWFSVHWFSTPAFRPSSLGLFVRVLSFVRKQKEKYKNLKKRIISTFHLVRIGALRLKLQRLGIGEAGVDEGSGGQEDAQELITTLFDKGYSRPPYRRTDGFSFALEEGAREFELPAGVELPLDGVTCEEGSRRCRRRGHNTENVVLQLSFTDDFIKRGLASLEELLHAFTRSSGGEQTGDVALKLERNDKDAGTVRNYDIVERMTAFPSTLLIQVKRTYFDMRTYQLKKTFAKVDVPTEFVYPESTETYQLVGYILQTGNGGGGHYVTWRRSPDGKRWYECDDSSVTEQPSSMALRLAQDAYVYLYKKVSSSGRFASSPRRASGAPVLFP